MKALIQASLAMSKAIKFDTDIWLTEVNDHVVDLYFDEAKEIAVIHVNSEVIAQYPELDFNVVICRLSSLKTHLKKRIDVFSIKGSRVSVMVEDLVNWKYFAKFRTVKVGYYEEDKGMEQIVPSTLKQRSIEINKGVFKDVQFDESTGKYFDFEWEHISTGKRGAFKNVEFHDAVGSDLVEYEIG
tara:strand:- start:207 stop:761 length:555 start_codon:yes stop_codon:yes gene_type:complete